MKLICSLLFLKVVIVYVASLAVTKERHFINYKKYKTCGEEVSMISVIEQNKLAFVILALVVLSLLIAVAFSIVSQVGGLEIAEASTLRYCVSSGGVCTGAI